MLYSSPSKLDDVSPSCSWGRRVAYSTPGQPPVAVALMVHSSRSFGRWLLSHWRFFPALSAGSSSGGTWHSSVPLLELSTEPMVFPALWQVPWDSRSLRVIPKFRLTSPGFGSGGAVLALVRPVVSYTLELSSQRSRPMMCPAVRSTAVLFPDR